MALQDLRSRPAAKVSLEIYSSNAANPDSGQLNHGDIILNVSNNSVFLLRKSTEIGKPLMSSAPREF